MLHRLLDYLGLPKRSHMVKLGLFGRLTFSWLWTDDPKYGELDEELRRQGK